MQQSARTDDPVHRFGSWAPPLLRPPDVIHMMNAPRSSQKVKTGEAWEQGSSD